MRATPIYSLSTELGANTIDPDKLNCRVRNGNGCDLVGINISLIKTSYCKKNKFGKEPVLQQFPSTLKSCSPLTRRVIASFQRQIIRKTKINTYFNLSGLKNMAKPHDLLVQIS